MTFFEGALSNGIAIGIDQNAHSPGISVRVLIMAGARQDPIPGAAHFLEHMLAMRPCSTDQSINDRLDELSLTSYFGTSKEYTLVSSDTVADNLPEVITLIGTALTHPAFHPDILQRERQRILHEQQIKREKYPGVAEYQRLLFASHPISNEVLGSPDSVRSMTAADLAAFHARHYVARNIAILASGNIDIAAFLAACEAHFSTIPNGSAAPAGPQPRFAHSPTMSIARTTENHEISAVIETPDASFDNQPAYRAVTKLLGNELSDRCQRSAINYSGCDAGHALYTDTGMADIRFQTPPEKADTAITTIQSALSQPQTWLTTEGFRRLQQGWKLVDAFEAADPRTRVSCMTQAYELTRSIKNYEDINARYDRLTFRDLLDAYSRFDLSNIGILSVGPAKLAPLSNINASDPSTTRYGLLHALTPGAP